MGEYIFFCILSTILLIQNLKVMLNNQKNSFAILKLTNREIKKKTCLKKHEKERERDRERERERGGGERGKGKRRKI